jgi:hypothetical protein
MIKKSIVVMLALGLCLSLTLTSRAATVVSIVAELTLSDVASIQFDILSPIPTAADFNANFPAGWFDFSSDKLISAFDGGGSNSLPTGEVGTFADMDVTLGGWALGDQSGTDIPDSKFDVTLVGSTFEITPVPIPSAILLLGGGLVSLIAIRRRRT